MNDPVDQLERSHRRLEEACDALRIAVEARDIETIGDVCGFFGRQVKRHEEDEEHSLFPRLSRENKDPELARVLEKLSIEHREHESLREELERLVSGRDAPPADDSFWTALGKVADRIADAYRAHIEVEEKLLFPAARKALSTAALEDIRTEMNERRGR